MKEINIMIFGMQKQSVQGSRLRVWKEQSIISIDWLFDIDCNKLKIENDMKITYDEKPCKIYLKTSSQKKYQFANNIN